MKKNKQNKIQLKYWHQVFKDLKGTKLLTKDRIYNISDNAAGWNTCVCGTQDPRLSVGRAKRPQDPHLSPLGLQFAALIFQLNRSGTAGGPKKNYGLNGTDLLMFQNLTGYAMEQLMKEIEARAEYLISKLKP